MLVNNIGFKVAITPDEVQKFEILTEKKQALENLIKVVDNAKELLEDDHLYNRFIGDYTETSKAFDELWNLIAEKYEVPTIDGMEMKLDFRSRIVSLQHA